MGIVKEQSSHYVYLMHTKQTCEFVNSIGRRSCEIIVEEKTPLPHEVDNRHLQIFFALRDEAIIAL